MAAEASPRYTRKPMTSVIVVTATADDSAGSRRRALMPSGTTTPLNPATTRFANIDKPTASVRKRKGLSSCNASLGPAITDSLKSRQQIPEAKRGLADV